MSFDFENEGETIRNPRFTCHECGFANVKLTNDGYAYCTNCRVLYVEERGS